MTLNIKPGLLKACSVVHSVLSQIHLMHYRKKKKKKVKLLAVYWDSTVFWDSDHIPHIKLHGTWQKILHY